MLILQNCILHCLLLLESSFFKQMITCHTIRPLLHIKILGHAQLVLFRFTFNIQVSSLCTLSSFLCSHFSERSKFATLILYYFTFINGLCHVSINACSKTWLFQLTFSSAILQFRKFCLVQTLAKSRVSFQSLLSSISLLDFVSNCL